MDWETHRHLLNSYMHRVFQNWTNKWCVCHKVHNSDSKFTNTNYSGIYIWAEVILQPFTSLHLHHSSFSNPSVALPTSQLILILKAFRHFTYVTAHSPILPSLYLRHNSFSNPCVALPTSQLILQPFFRLSYVTGFSLTSPGKPPMSGRRESHIMHI